MTAGSQRSSLPQLRAAVDGCPIRPRSNQERFRHGMEAIRMGDRQIVLLAIVLTYQGIRDMDPARSGDQGDDMARLRPGLISALLALVVPFAIANEPELSPPSGQLPEWASSVALSKDFRTYAAFESFDSMSRTEANGPGLVKSFANVNDAELPEVLDRARAVSAASATFQARASARLCARSHELNGVTAIGTAMNDLQDEVFAYQEQLGSEVWDGMSAGLSAKLRRHLDAANGVGQYGGRTDVLKLLIARKIDPNSYLQQFCASVDLIK